MMMEGELLFVRHAKNFCVELMQVVAAVDFVFVDFVFVVVVVDVLLLLLVASKHFQKKSKMEWLFQEQEVLFWTYRKMER